MPFSSRRAAWGGPLNLLMQPSAGIGPQAIGRSRRDAEDFGRLSQRQARKVTEMDQLDRRLVRGRQLIQGLVERHQVFRLLGESDLQTLQILADVITAALVSSFAARIVHQ